jgi:hypothetical protein
MLSNLTRLFVIVVFEMSTPAAVDAVMIVATHLSQCIIITTFPEYHGYADTTLPERSSCQYAHVRYQVCW